MRVASAEQLEDAVRRLGLPLVLKSDHSWGGEGVVIATTREDVRAAFHKLTRRSRLRDAARAMRGRGSHFLTRALFPVTPRISAQRFVEGRPATSSIACWQGAVVGAMHFDVLLSTTPNSPASVIAAAPCPEMEAAARAVAQAFNLSGLFGLDYIRDRDGHAHLLEMNPRATPTVHLTLPHDLPAALMQAAGLPARARPPMTDQREIALFPREWLRDPTSPWLARAYHDVPWDDAEVVRSCVRGGPPAARALLESGRHYALTTKSPAFGG
jgi:biotin carboxylase